VLLFGDKVRALTNKADAMQSRNDIYRECMMKKIELQENRLREQDRERKEMRGECRKYLELPTCVKKHDKRLAYMTPEDLKERDEADMRQAYDDFR
jgi:hypothetical protein